MSGKGFIPRNHRFWITLDFQQEEKQGSNLVGGQKGQKGLEELERAGKFANAGNGGGGARGREGEESA